jgi:hypothetical protein
MQVPNEYQRFKWINSSTLIGVILTMIIGPYLFPKILDVLVRMFLYIAASRMVYMVICSVISLYKARRVPYLQKDQYKTDAIYAWVIPSYN